MENLGQNIKQTRVQKGISQEYMAYKLGISQSKFSRMENSGNHIPLDMVNKIAKVLDVEPEALLLTNKSMAVAGNNRENDANNDLLNEEIKFLKEELKEKDKQIEHKDEQIELLIKREFQINLLSPHNDRTVFFI